MNTVGKLLSASMLAVIAVSFGVADPAFAAAKIIKVSHPGTPDHPWHRALAKYAELVAQRTNGAYALELYPNAQLAGGNERTMVEQLMTGTQQMALFPSTLATQKMMVFALPFLFTDRKKIDEICDGPIGDELLKFHETLDLKALAFWENGFRQFTNNTRPILTTRPT